MIPVLLIIVAFLLDLVIGDPYHWPHPIKWIGNYIYWFLKGREKWKGSLYLYGAVLWISTVGLSIGITYAVLWGLNQLHPIVYWIAFTYIAYTTLATRSLAFEANKVYKTLVNGTIEEARYQVSMIVGRQTDTLTKEEIVQATVETVAENTSDGVIGPLICLFIGGPVMAMAYKAINTLDSMVGYKQEPYSKLGFWSAKIDDLANLIPARVSFAVLLLSAHVLQYDIKQTFRIAWRDRYQHASPNSAFTEAVVAGALNIQLGGAHYYHGELVDKPTIGDNQRPVVDSDILKTCTLLYISACLSVFIFASIALSFFLIK